MVATILEQTGSVERSAGPIGAAFRSLTDGGGLAAQGRGRMDQEGVLEGETSATS